MSLHDLENIKYKFIKFCYCPKKPNEASFAIDSGEKYVIVNKTLKFLWNH